ncbi:MAG: tetratricopeptide repeat protein [Terracidiphilus sp.]|nr:tetratricopeptide repeat protein [Terracidiphilus sp.]
MGLLLDLLYPLGLLLEVVAIVHYFKRRPEMYWFFVIVFLGPLGAAIYLGVEALPDFVALAQGFKGAPRQRRVIELEAAVRDNPSAANYEELGDLYMDTGNPELARAAFDKAIAARSDTLDSFYRRGLCALKLGDAAAALPDLERVVQKEPAYDFHRAAGLLAHACAKAGQNEKAGMLFQKAILASTLSETYLNYAEFLAAQGRHAEARQWAQKVLDKEPTMPAHLRRRERPWFQTANEMLKRLPV